MSIGKLSYSDLPHGVIQTQDRENTDLDHFLSGFKNYLCIDITQHCGPNYSPMFFKFRTHIPFCNSLNKFCSPKESIDI